MIVALLLLSFAAVGATCFCLRKAVQAAVARESEWGASVDRFYRRPTSHLSCDLCRGTVFRRLHTYGSGCSKLRCLDCGNIRLAPNCRPSPVPHE